MLNELQRSILLALIAVVFCTKNGRSLMMKLVRDGLHFIPISIRRLALSNSWRLPLRTNRFFLNMGTCPIGKENQWVQKVKKDNWEGVWIGPNLNSLNQAEEIAVNQDVILYYIHGGGFVMGHATMYMETFQTIIKTLYKEFGINASILSLEYGLSPEQVWPKACFESVDGYRYLIHDLSIPPSKVIFMGDSAGGNIVASTLLILKDQRNIEELKELPPLPFPAGAALFSPWIDLTPVQTIHQSDTLSSNLLSRCLPYYLQDLSLIQHPHASPFYGAFDSAMCSLFISYGEHELLRNSIESFISKLEANDCHPVVLKGENESHIWFMSSLMSTSKQVYQKDLKALITWITGCCQA